MVKMSVLIKRKQGMSSSEFHRYWREKHGPLAMGTKDFMSHIRRYVQSHQLPDEKLQGSGRAAAQYDGIVELWADSLEELDLAFASDGYKNVIHRDEANFCDDSEVICMITEDVVMKK